MGFAIADNLGLIDADYLNLRNCKTENEKPLFIRQWLRFAIKQLKPPVIVLESVDRRRLNGETRNILMAMKDVIDKNPEIRCIKTTRKTALLPFASRSSPTERQCIRNLSKQYSKTCPLLRFHPPPVTSERTDWDRSWGQAAVAAALALHIKSKYS